MTTKKYIVYENDLKYKQKRNLDKSKIIWYDDNLNYLYSNVDLDTFEYRLAESKKNEYMYLDITNMDLDSFPKIPQVPHNFLALASLNSFLK